MIVVVTSYEQMVVAAKSHLLSCSKYISMRLCLHTGRSRHKAARSGVGKQNNGPRPLTGGASRGLRGAPEAPKSKNPCRREAPKVHSTKTIIEFGLLGASGAPPRPLREGGGLLGASVGGKRAQPSDHMCTHAWLHWLSLVTVAGSFHQIQLMRSIQNLSSYVVTLLVIAII